MAVAMAVFPGAADPHPGHGPVVIDIGALAYNPTDVTVTAGDFVLWFWRGPDTNHSVTSDAGQAMSFDSDPGRSPAQVQHPVGDGFSLQFPTPGTYRFHCKVHAFMKGTVTVQPGAAGSTPGPAVAPVLTKVRVSPGRLCNGRRSCTRAAVTASFTVNEAVSMRALLRRAGKTVKEIDFNGPPGPNHKRLAFGRLRPGRYGVQLIAVDLSTGLQTTARVITLRVGR